MKRSLPRIALLWGIVFFTVSLAPVSLRAASPEKLIVTGTGSSIGTMRLVAGAFQKKYPHVTVDVLPSIGSSGGIKAVSERKIDIGLSSRPLKQEEAALGIIEEPYGRTAFVFGTHESNPQKAITLQEIEDIYSGKRNAWRDGAPLRLILRPLSDAYTVYLAGITPGMKAAVEKANAIPGVFVGTTDQDAAAQIEKTQGSLGITSGCIIAAEKRKIKTLSVDGIPPTPANVASGKYPYTMTMSVVYRKDDTRAVVKNFVDFTFSGPGQKILSQSGHIPLKRNRGK